jgi:uncharacterized membrane protein YtjA (UPF0391 family)
MLGWSVTFLLVALLAGLLGFWGIAGMAAYIAKVLFVIFLVLFLVSLIVGRRVTWELQQMKSDEGGQPRRDVRQRRTQSVCFRLFRKRLLIVGGQLSALW